MHHQPLPSLDRLQDLFRPNFMTGELFWKQPRGHKKAGALAGFQTDRGYVRIGIDGRVYLAHRVLYAMYHKQDPADFEVDHADLDTTDNCVRNLRLTTRAQNGQNIPGYRKGLKGAYRNSASGKPWVSTIQTNGVRRFLGLFDTEEEAHAAYVVASAIHHGEFGRAH
jgi:hypothetical protein